MMRKVYLVLSVIGFILPSILVFQESVETGNVLLYKYPMDTLNSMLANRISSVFTIDLLWGVMVFFVLLVNSFLKNIISKKQMMGLMMSCMLLGFAGAFPLFLYFKADNR